MYCVSWGICCVVQAAQVVLISLFELNTPEFTMLLGALPKTFQDGATKLLHNHLKNSSNTSSVVRSPVSSLIIFYINILKIYLKDFLYIMFCSVMFTKAAFIWSKNTVITVILWNSIAFSKNRFPILIYFKLIYSCDGKASLQCHMILQKCWNAA